MERPVITCTPVRNELHNLKRLLPVWQTYSDYIIICDQQSTDGSREFVSRSDKVVVVDNPGKDYDETERISLMLEKAREISKNAILLFTDADEALSANVLHSPEWQEFQRMPAGTTGYFLWVQLWRNVRRYVANYPVGKPVHMPFAFIDDGRDLVGAQIMHGPRGPGFADPTHRFYFNEVVNLHFFLTNLEVYKKKQNWYKVWWIKRGSPYFHTNRNHSAYDKLNITHTEISPPEWYEEYVNRGINLFSSDNPELMHYDIFVLQYLKNAGKRAWLLDIWNQDWQHLAQLARQKGIDVPDKIVPPPFIIRLYHDLTLGRMSWLDLFKMGWRFAKRKILP